MNRVPPAAIVIVTVSAIVTAVVLGAPVPLLALSTPPVLVLVRDSASRRRFGARLLLLVPLVMVAVVMRWFAHAPPADLVRPPLRVLAAVAWSSWLSARLHPREIDAALRTLGLPPALVDLLAQTRRFGTQLKDTLIDAWSAATLRGGLLSWRSVTRTAGSVAGVVVVRAIDRSETVATAACLRGAPRSTQKKAALLREMR